MVATIVYPYLLASLVAMLLGLAIGIFSWFLGFSVGAYLDRNGVAQSQQGQIFSSLGYTLAQLYNMREASIEQWVSEQMETLENPTGEDFQAMHARRPLNWWKAWLCSICRTAHLANLVFVVGASLAYFLQGISLPLSMYLLSWCIMSSTATYMALNIE